MARSKVIILPETTEDPISLIGRRAGVCWGADITDKEKNFKRGVKCIKDNHGRTFEFVTIESVLDGYSARVIREWYTHIGGSPTRLQASTRYIDYSDFDFVSPISVRNNKDNDAQEAYIDAINQVKVSCRELDRIGVPKEDIALLLPLGMTTKIVDKRNLRNVIDMSKQRLCNRAYWEYRKLMKDYIDELYNYSYEWNYLIDKLDIFKPKCKELGYCPESNGCGIYPARKGENVIWL